MKKSISLLFFTTLSFFGVAQQADKAFRQDVNANAIAAAVPHPGVTIEFHKYFLYALPAKGNIREHVGASLLYEGNVKAKKLHGDWKSWYRNGLLCDSGKLVKGLPDGEWKHWDTQGNLVAVRTYSASKYFRVQNDVVRYNARRVNLPIVTLYKKNRKTAARHLMSAYSFPAEKTNHAEHSLYQLVLHNISAGNNYHPVFENNLHHGLFINYMSNGLARDSGYYTYGLRHGVWIHRNNDLSMERGVYTNGKKADEWRLYDVRGKIREIYFYNKEGLLSGKKSFR